MRILSPIASTARGSVAGQTYQANQSASIVIRAKTAPIQHATTLQSMIKSAFSDASVAWKDMSDANRQGWSDYADTLIFNGPQGTYKLPGRQLFMSNYGLFKYLKNRGYIAQALNISPPKNPGFLGIQDLDAHPHPVHLDWYIVRFTNPNPEPSLLFVLNSRSFDKSRIRYKGPWNTDTIFRGGVGCGGSYDVLVKNCNPGSRYFCKVRAITLYQPIRTSHTFYLRVDL